MKKKVRKKLNKRIRNLYFKSGQRLVITPHCIFNRDNDWSADIYAVDKETKDPYDNKSIYLFSIRTQDCFVDSIFIPEWSRKFLCQDLTIKNISELYKISYTPFYFEYPKENYRVFTLKREGNITKDDIERCLRYFSIKILEQFLPLNIEIEISFEDLEEVYKGK